MLTISSRVPMCAGLLLTLQLVACGGGGGGGNDGGGNPPPPPPATGPTVVSLTPNTVSAGTFDPVVYVDGNGFLADSVVNANASPRTTTYVSATRLRVNLTALDVASPGSVNLTVANPGGSTSSARALSVGASTYTVRELQIPFVQQMVWDAANGDLYALSGDTSLYVIEPVSGTSQVVPVPGGNASTMLMSDDGQYIYFGRGNAIQRCTLPDLAVELSIPFGAGTPGSLAIAPGAPQTIAIGGNTELRIIDNDVMRPNIATYGSISTLTEITFGADASVVYARTYGSSFNDLYTVSVNANGAQTLREQTRAVTIDTPASGIHFDPSQQRLHLGNGTQFAQVIDPVAHQWSGRFDAPGLASVDLVNNKVFFLFYTAPGNATIAAYDLTTYAFIDAISFPQTGTGIGQRMVPYGNDGLAFSANNRVYLVNGPFVSGRPTPPTVQPNTTTVSGQQVTVIAQPADDLVWSPADQLIYLAVPGLDPVHGNSIVALNPGTGQIVAERRVLSDPQELAISDDGAFLYAGLRGSGSIQRFSLPGLLPDVNMPLGWIPFFGGAKVALDLSVAPGAPRTLAAAIGSTNPITPASSTGGGHIAIYDDAVRRPIVADNGVFNSVRWGTNASTLYAADGEDTGANFYTLSVDPGGIQVSNNLSDAFSPFFARIHFDAPRARIYSDNGGIVDVVNATRAGDLGASGLIAIDSGLGRAWSVPQSPFSGSAELQLRSINLQTVATISTLTLPAVTGRPMRLIRWGMNGLAFNTEAGDVYLISGNFVN